MNLWDALQRAGALIIPPPVNADDKTIMRWRWSVAGFLVLALVGPAFHIALACGRIPSLFAGFADRDQLKAVLVRMAKHDIIEYRTKECHSTDKIGRGFAHEALMDALADYQRNAGVPYGSPPSCDEV